MNGHFRTSAGLALAAGLLLFAPPGYSQGLPSAIQAMEGRWNGTYEIRNGAGQILRLIEVEYQYWIDGGILNGLAVFEEGGDLSHARSRSFMEKGRLVTEIESGGIRRRFLGRVADNSVIWTPEDAGPRPRRKIKETVVEREEKAYLVIDGFERLQRGEDTATVVYKGLLEKEKNALESETRPN